MASWYSLFSATGGPHTGAIGDPYTFSEWLSLVENGGQAAGDIFRSSGIRTYNGVDFAMGTANQVLDGWGGTATDAYEIWGVNGTVDYYGAVDNADGLTTSRGVFNASAIFSCRFAADSYKISWKSCYFYHGVSLQLDSNHSKNVFTWKGCTFNTPLFAVGYNGQVWHKLNFDFCLFNGTVFDVDSSGYQCTFTNCWFTKTQAEVSAAIQGTPVFTNCTFSVTLDAALLTDITTITPETLRYSTFFPVEHSGDFTDFDHGFASEDRQGPGAFYFGIAQATGTATPTKGSAPLDVRFSTSPEEDVDVQWDFNDGTYSEEWQVSKRYAAAGKYEVTLTWTDRLGNTSTQTFTIYVYDWDYTGSGPWASYTDECLRLSMKPAKGMGWSEFGGGGWPFPEARVGPLKIIDESNRERQLVMDSLWGRVVEIGMTEGFKDLAGGYDEQDISTEIRFPEEIGEAEHYFLESLEHHAGFRPFSEDDGYQEDFAVDFSLLKDGAQSDTLKTQEIPLNGDIVLRPQDEAHRWQPRIVTTASGYRLVRLRDYYVVRDKAAAPGDRVMTEQDWEGDLADVLMHLGRNSLNPVLNLATGVDFTGTYSYTVTGPDGRDNSALAFVGAGLTSANSLSLTGDFSFCGWVGNIGTTQTIVNQGFRVRVVIGADTRLEYRDSGGTYISSALSWSGSGWAMLTVVRSGSTLSMYHDDTLVFSQEISVVANTGAVEIFPSSTGYAFDMKIIDGALESGAVDYHHSDVVNKEGVSTCPLF